MKIGIIFTLKDYGGVQTCVISLIKGLNQQGIIPTIIWGDAPNKKIIKENNLEVEFEKVSFLIPTNLIHKLPSSIRHILWPFNMVKASKLKKKYDFIYTFSHIFYNDISIPYFYYLSGPPFLPQLYPQKGIGKIRYQLLHGFYELFLKPFYPIYEFQGNAQNTAINSEFTSSLFFEAHGLKLPVVYPSNLFKKSNIKGFKKKKDIIFLSRIVPYKRPELILELAKQYPDESFIIVGAVSSNRKEYYQSLVSFVKKNHLNNVTFKINEDYSVIQEILVKAKIYVFLTKNEHFGITTVEAIMNGVIPFVHNSGGQKEIVNIEELRFEDDTFFSQFEKLINLDESTLMTFQEHFYRHSDDFSEDMFVQKLLSKLKNLKKN